MNDADYQLKVYDYLGAKPRLVSSCPFYSRWKDMLKRCYCDGYQARNPTYKGCTVVPEWLCFMQFRKWMSEQDWQGKQLDKDVLFPGNKVYGPDTCVFLEPSVNYFMTEKTSARGQWPIGVCYSRSSKGFIASCFNVTSHRKVTLGLFKTPEAAHAAWLEYKLSQARILAAQQTDPRVAAALVARYENYTDSAARAA
ncbi:MULTISPECIES: hypothetical protein [unclassified Pseudomonas]|uniref:hypothetical protein n=1 Tax=unclassified Pseudomonas TaxID=196821 RepID=UPI002360C890|nr:MULTISPECIES: hypothetical protein [unclassified Pseudomonas]